MAVSHILLSENGPEFSRIAAGLWRLHQWNMSGTELLDWIKTVMDMGITTFDHADIYGGYTCEAIFGQSIKGKSSLREQMQIVTKCGIKLRPQHPIKQYDTSREHLLASVENSLKNLQTDYIDLLLIHRPDPLMDADEVAEAFIELWEEGKVLNFGVSNFTTQQFTLLDSRLPEFDLVTNQIEFSVLNTNAMYDGTLDWCQLLRISPMAWSPLGGGSLFRGDTEQSQHLQKTLTEIGDTLGGVSLDQVALAWLLKHPSNVVPVLGSGRIERIQAAVEAESLELSREQWFMILEASTGKEVP